MDPQEDALKTTDALPADDPRKYIRDIPLLCMALQIAPQQAKLLSLLLTSRIVTPVMAYEHCGCNDASVAIHRLRQRIQKQHGIQIYAQYSVGYALTQEHRKRTCDLIVAFATDSELAFDAI